VVKEVQEIKKLWKHARIGFADDNLFVDLRYSRELVASLGALNVLWFAQSDISIARDQEFLTELYRCGCKFVLIGFESVSKDNLHTLNTDQWKEKRFDRYSEDIARIQNSGIGVFGSFILGLDNDQPSTFSETVKFIVDNSILTVQLSILTPFPGSRLRTRLEQENRILHSDWQWYTVMNAVIRHPRFAAEELEQGLLRAYQGIYNIESNERRARYFRRIFENLLSAG